MSFALHLHQVFVKESKYTLKHVPATLSLAFISHSFHPHPRMTGPCSCSTPTSILTQGAMLLRAKIYSLLFSHSLVKRKGIWAVGQFAPVHYHIFSVWTAKIPDAIHISWPEPGTGILPRVALADKCVNTRFQMQPWAHKTLTPTTVLFWETSNTQKDKLCGTEFSGVIPTREMNSLEELLLAPAVYPFACLEWGNSPESLGTLCPRYLQNARGIVHPHGHKNTAGSWSAMVCSCRSGWH